MDVVMAFHVHQPFRLRRFSVFNDLEKPPNKAYFDSEKNRAIFERVSKKCYFPATEIIKDLSNNGYKFTYSITGTWVESAKLYNPDVLSIFKETFDTGNVELLGETYYHSLSSLYSGLEEFKIQVKMHKKMARREFKQKTKTFRNTELIYDNRIGTEIEKMKFKGIITEGVDRILEWRSPTDLYRRVRGKLPIMLRHYKLSDDIGFRFSARDWACWPLTADKYADWISNLNGQYVLLYIDYETFGEHQWPETGILDFLEHLPGELEKRGNELVTPSDVLKKQEPVGEYDSPWAISWADESRDVSTWLGNRLQQEIFKRIQGLEEVVSGTELEDTWRKIQTADHLYYLSTKATKDGVIHKYFNPYDSPYDAFINIANIIEDIRRRAEKK